MTGDAVHGFDDEAGHQRSQIMHPTIAQGLVQQRYATFLQQADAARLAAQAREVRHDRSHRSVSDRLAATATRIRVGIWRQDPFQPAASADPVGRGATATTRPTNDTPTPLAPALRPVTWARAGSGSLGAAGRTLTGSSDVAPPSPSL